MKKDKVNPRVEFDLQQFKRNIAEIKQKAPNIEFLFPVKCCNNETVLDIVASNGFGFDISNINEMKIINKYLDGRFVSVSGPLAFELRNYDYSNIHTVANNFSGYIEGNGLRINFNSNKNFNSSRFGVDYLFINNNIKMNIEYIHFHNSDHRDMKKSTFIYEEVQKLLFHFPNLKHINIGGHLEDLTFDEGINYLNEMRKIIPQNILLSVELGDFLFKKVGKLYCSIVDINSDNDIQLVTLNFSKMANQRWAYPVYNDSSKSKKKIKTIFYGCSCCETDIYLETTAKELNVGEQLIFENISPYSYQWNMTFNGVDKIEYIFM